MTKEKRQEESMTKQQGPDSWRLPRRDFLYVAGAAAAGAPLLSGKLFAGGAGDSEKRPATVRVAFVYPPTEKLDKEGYYSWPGSTFDAEGRQKQYTRRLEEIEQELGMSLRIDEVPLDAEASVTRFIQEVQSSKPDGLLLIPFKKSHWEQVVRIVEEARIPTVILATLGILLNRHLQQLHSKPGVFLINSLDNLDAVARGLRMVRTARWMYQSRIVNITGTELQEDRVPIIGTRVRTIPHERFYAAFRETGPTDEVRDLARTYLETAKDRVEPTEDDVLEAAKTYFVFRRIISEEKADAVMMNCLPGLKRPHQHVPPCMGFMTLRDEGTPMGCESDLDATLTMMLLQQLFDRPGFQHNPSADTEKNHYFCAHCTSASKMNGVNEPSEPYVLRNHAEAGWGCVPRVLMREGQEVTIAKYLSASSESKPQMIVYTGTIVGCPPIPPTGGCRTNVEATINELKDVCDVKGHHLSLVYGNYARELRDFCQLYDIEVVV
jgi:hypothetical protein